MSPTTSGSEEVIIIIDQQENVEYRIPVLPTRLEEQTQRTYQRIADGLSPLFQFSLALTAISTFTITGVYGSDFFSQEQLQIGIIATVASGVIGLTSLTAYCMASCIFNTSQNIRLV